MDVLTCIQNTKEEEEFYGVVQSGSEDEQEENQHRYNKLVDAVISIDGKKRRIAPQRSEPRTEVSEYTVHDASHDKVKLHELALSLGKNSAHGTLKRAIRQTQRRQKVLSAPLPKAQAEKINRTLNYDKTKEEISKWDSVVQHNRLATQIVYPLNQPDIRLKTGPELARQFKPMTPLEQEVMALLQGSKNVLKDDRLLTPAEEEAFQSMNLEEALEKRRALQKMRTLQSYMEAKARRQNKIKSKRYHRLLKKEKLKAYMKEFEELRQKDPEAAIKKLDEINQQRIIERMTLRHRGTGKWAKHMALRAKYDIESRHALSEQLRINKELTQKKNVTEEKSDEEEEEKESETVNQQNKKDPFNPWININSTRINAEDTSEPPVSYRKEWDKSRQDIAELKEMKKKKKKSKTEMSKNKEMGLQKKNKKLPDLPLKVKIKGKKLQETSNKSDDKKLKKNPKITKKKQNEEEEESHPLENPLEDEDPILLEADLNNSSETSLNSSWIPKELNQDAASNNMTKELISNQQMNSNNSEEEIHIDPKKFVVVETRTLKSAMPNIIEPGEDEEDKHLMTINEAFADDDVIHSFREAKKAIVDRDKPKDISTYLPGWGIWGGSGIKENNHRKNKFLIKAPPAPPRKDQQIGHVIIHEAKDEAISKYQVNELPFPFNNVASFESSIRAPLGKQWNTESAHRDLIEPKIVTKPGAIIEPIDSDVLINKKKPFRRNPKLPK